MDVEDATHALLIGEGRLADAAARALADGGAGVRRLPAPDDREVRDAIDDSVERVLIVSRFDHVSLRLALLVEHIRPGMPLLVTIFDRDVAARLRDAVDHVHVLSMADIVAPAFAGPCLDQGLLSIVRDASGAHGIRPVDGVPQRVPASWPTPTRAERVTADLRALARPFEPSAQILLAGVAGIVGVFLTETLVTMLVDDYGVADAVYSVAKVTVTAGPNPAAEHGGSATRLLSALLMILSLGFIALLTAGLVNRLLDPRLTGIRGRTAVPRRDHVIVVGLGQVGLRLCGLLRELGIPVVAVEHNRDAKNLTRARDQQLPVVLGTGSSQRLLRRLSIDRARALAAVTSDEVENIAIAVAARSVCDQLHLSFRAGDGDLASDTRALFKVGVVRDVYQLAGAALAAAALGQDAREAFPHAGAPWLVDGDGTIIAAAPVGPAGPSGA